jgi:NADH:ubiquinone oxidoreductase subunit E
MVVQPDASGSPPFYSEFSRPPNASAHVKAIQTKSCQLRLEESNNQYQPSEVLFGKGEVVGEEASIDQAVGYVHIHGPADSCGWLRS